MTIDISNNAARVNYTVAQGATQTSFSVPFEFFNDADLSVYVDDVLKTITTHYTVSGGDGSTGTVTISVTGASGGSTVVISRSIAIERTSDFVTGVDINRAALNTQLDTLTAIAADNKDKASRSISAPNSEVNPQLELPDADTRKGKLVGFNETTGNVELSATLADGNTLASISGDIATLADIEDGTNATDAIQTVAGISSNVTTVAGISANVTSVAGNASNINTVASDETDIGIVAGISSDVTTVSGISSDVTIVAADGADIGVVAGISSDVITVSGKSVEIGRLGTADAVADMNALGTTAIIADMDSLADNVSAISVVAEDIGNVIAVAGNASNINTVAADGADIGTVSGSIASVNTVASDISNINANATNIGSINTNAANITDIQNASANAASALASKNAAEAALDEFTDIYLGAKTSDPTTDNDGNALTAGDQYFNTTLNVLKIYNGSAWQAAAIDTLGFVEVTGDTMTGDLSFGDNDKAIFGAGSDLQIYHDGSASYIDDAGSGRLNIRSNDLRIEKYTGETIAKFIADGAVELNYNDVKKLATTSTGVDITGTLTSDGLTVDGSGVEVISVNSTQNGAQINFDSASTSVDWSIGVSNSADGDFLIYQSGSGSGDINLYTGGLKRQEINRNGDISFYEDTGTTPKFFWDASAEALTIGDAATQAPLSVETNSSGFAISIEENAGAETWQIGVDVDGDLNFYNSTLPTPQFTVSDSGNVGIGTGSPSETLHLRSTLGGENGAILIEAFAPNIKFNDLSSPVSDYQILVNNSFNIKRDAAGDGTFEATDLTIDSSGNVGIGTSSPSRLLSIDSGATSNGRIHFTNTATGSGTSNGFFVGQDSADGKVSLWNLENEYMRFATNNTERMRIDSSGNIGIGTSSPSDALHVYNTSSLNHVRIDGPAGINRNLNFSTSGSTRWNIYANSTAESGSNSGSNLTISKYTDAGVYNGVAMFIERSSGSVGIGTSSPNTSLDVSTSSSTVATFRVPSGGGANNKRLEVATGGDRVIFKAYTDSDSSATAIAFNNGASSEAMRIDSSGNLLVGTTDPDNQNNSAGSSADNGFAVNNVGHFNAARYNGIVQYLNLTGTDGDIVQFRKDGSPVGSIGASVGNPYMASTGCGFRITGASVRPTNTSGVNSDNTVDLGFSSARWKDLYLSGGVYLGGTGAANKLEDYEEGTFTPTLSWRLGSVPTSGETISGKYTKIGRLVTVTAQIYYNGSTVTPVVGTDVIGIGSLPFVGTLAGHDLWGDTGAGVQTDGSGMYNSAAWSAIILPTSPSAIFMKCISVDGSVTYDEPINITITYTTSS